MTYKDKILEINGKNIPTQDFEDKLKDLIFNLSADKPTFRQIVAKNIRDEDYKLSNTIKVLHSTTTYEEYEALYFFWLGINTDDLARKQQLYERKKAEERLLIRLKQNRSESEIEQALKILYREIESLELEKKYLNLNHDLESDLDALNTTKKEINARSNEITQLELRLQLIDESLSSLKAEKADIDTDLLKEIYTAANKFIPELDKSFNELVRFHNKMISERINFISNDIPKYEATRDELKNVLSNLMTRETELTNKINKSSSIIQLEPIINQLNHNYELKGSYEEQLKQLQQTEGNLQEINLELEKINNGIITLDSVIEERVTEFNKYFSDLSNKLYGEKFLLFYEHNDRAFQLKITNIEGNLGTGKKKGQIVAFDLAHIQFCDENRIPCLHFIMHDQLETVHDNQLEMIAEISNNINAQFIVPILRDKLPETINAEDHTVLTLSQNDKLFKI